MSQHLFAADTSLSLVHLDANFSEVYGFSKSLISDGSGNAYVGTQNSDPTFNRVNATMLRSGGGFLIRTAAACDFGFAGTSGTHISFYTDNGSARVTAGSISSSGNTTSYNTSSDRRLKTRLRPAPRAGVVIDAIQVLSFDWLSDRSTVRWGVVAQDLHAVAPEAVTVGDSGAEVERAWAVDHSKLVPLLIAEVQSLRQRVATLEAGV